MKVFYQLSLLLILSLVGWQNASAQLAPTDCIFDAPDITDFIHDGIQPANYQWGCSDGTTTILPTTLTTSPLTGLVITRGTPSCSGTATPVDAWYQFTPTAAKPLAAWVDLYEGNETSDLVVELYETTTPVGGSCAALTGAINYIGCSDSGSGDFSDRERSICTLGEERIDVSSLTAGTTYYLRIFEWGATVAPTTPIDFFLCAESSTTTFPAEDNCEDLDNATSGDDNIIEATAGCADTDPVGKDVVIFYANQSNAGAFGNSASGTEGGLLGPCILSDYSTNGSIPTGSAGPASIDNNCNDDGSDDVTSIVVNNVINNNVMYAIRVSPCEVTPNPQARISLKLDNLVAIPPDGTLQITVVGPAPGTGTPGSSDVDFCSGTGVGAALFTAAHDVASGSCIEIENNVENISGVYGLFIEGSNGTLIKWDLTVNIDYLGTCSDNAGPCQSGINGGNTPTPAGVELSGFVGRTLDKGNELAWTTYSETNNEHFEVERSVNGKDFTRLAFVDGKGTTTEAQRYVWFDNQAPVEAYYRLKQVDFDGEYTYSDVLFLSRKNDAVSINSVTPNPTVNEANLSFNTNAAGTATISVTDMFGKQISTKEVATIAGENKETLDLATQAAGVYFVTINYGEYQVVKKIMKN